jgi:hypothetical protein
MDDVVAGFSVPYSDGQIAMLSLLACSGALCSAFVENKVHRVVRSAELRRFG